MSSRKNIFKLHAERLGLSATKGQCFYCCDFPKTGKSREKCLSLGITVSGSSAKPCFRQSLFASAPR